MSTESCACGTGDFDTRLDSAAVPADRAPLVLRAIRRLARGEPVSRDDVGIEDLAEWDELKRLGAEVDDADRIVGLGGLSTRPTRHRFVVGDRELFTWCALDTLFLPHLLGEAASVRSTCPATGEPIFVRVSPAGIEEAAPEGIVISLVRAESAGEDDDRKGSDRQALFGSGGSFCSRVHFFVSSEAGTSWLANQPDAVVVSLDEAFRIGRETCSLPLLGSESCEQEPPVDNDREEEIR